MKILIISDAWKPQINGVVRTYEYLIPELEKMGHSVKVISPSDFSITFPMPGYSEIKLALFTHRKLSQIIDSFSPDTLHIATEGPLGVSTQKICKRHNIPFSTSYHTQFPDYVQKRAQKIVPFMANYLYKKAVQKMVRFHNATESILVTTPTIEKQLKQWGVTSRILPFTRGVDESIFNMKDKETPQSFQNLKRPIALYVGRIAIEKSIKDFLNMPWNGSKVVIGQGPDQPMLEKKYPDALFTGKKTGADLAQYYSASDVFVFPSKTDTFGMVIIEALACGLCIAAYPAPGPEDIITENFLGSLNDDLSIAAKNALESDGRDKKKQRSDYTLQNYTWEKAAKHFLEACPINSKEQKAL